LRRVKSFQSKDFSFIFRKSEIKRLKRMGTLGSLDKLPELTTPNVKKNTLISGQRILSGRAGISAVCHEISNIIMQLVESVTKYALLEKSGR